MHIPAESPCVGFVVPLSASAFMLLASLNFAASTFGQTATTKCPPATTVNFVHDAYGTTDVVDPYRWLEYQNSPETRAWIEAEQKCTEAALSPLSGRAAIAKRIGELLRTDTLSTPIEHG